MKHIIRQRTSLFWKFSCIITLSLGALGTGQAESLFFGTVTGQIFQVNSDGSNLNLIYNSPLTDFRAMAVDDLNGHLYVQNASNQTIMRMNLDGTGATTFATGVDLVLSMQVDPSAGKLFYSLIDWEASNATVVSRNLDGTGEMTIFTSVAQSNTVGISIDPIAQRVYVADSGQVTGTTTPHAVISSVSYSGADLDNIYTNLSASEIAVGGGNLFSYGYFSIERGTTEGGAQQSIFSPGYPNSLIAGLVTNPEGDMIYAAQIRNTGYGFDRLVSMDINGGNVTTLASVGTNWTLTDLAYSTSTSTVPEASTWALFSLGALTAGFATYRHHRHRA